VDRGKTGQTGHAAPCGRRGGCSGFQYRYGLAESVEADDTVVETDGVKLVVDRSASISLPDAWSIMSSRWAARRSRSKTPMPWPGVGVGRRLRFDR
jgi:hypothetical protein